MVTKEYRNRQNEAGEAGTRSYTDCWAIAELAFKCSERTILVRMSLRSVENGLVGGKMT